MALASTQPQRSIFSGAITGDAIETVRSIGTKTLLTAGRVIHQGAEYSIQLATPEALREASVATGIETEVIQDQIANLAHTDYGAYIAYKQNVLVQLEQKY